MVLKKKLKSSYFYFTGPRACPGESLAKTELFLVFSNLIQKFRFSKVSVDDVLDFTGITGITTCASPYRLKVKSRHDWQQKLTTNWQNWNWQQTDNDSKLSVTLNWQLQQTDSYNKLTVNKLILVTHWQQTGSDNKLTLITHWHC